MTKCELCGCSLRAGTRVVRFGPDPGGGLPTITELTLPAGQDGALAYFCAEHTGAIRSLRTWIDDPAALERAVRGRLFQELDILAFALEMECAEALAAGREEEAARAQQTRLGVRLAQRLVGDVPAPEIRDRLRRWRGTYRDKFPD